MKKKILDGLGLESFNDPVFAILIIYGGGGFLAMFALWFVLYFFPEVAK